MNDTATPTDAAIAAARDTLNAIPMNADTVTAIADATNAYHAAVVATFGAATPTTDPYVVGLLGELDDHDRAAVVASGVTVELDGATVTFRLGDMSESMSPDGYVDITGELFTVDDIDAWNDMFRSMHYMDGDAITSLATLIHVGTLV